MKASIIVPTCDRGPLLATSVASLANQCFPAGDYEILAVDNGSTDSTRSVVEETIHDFRQHCIRYRYEPVPGLLSGRHCGALEARADILAFNEYLDYERKLKQCAS